MLAALRPSRKQPGQLSLSSSTSFYFQHTFVHLLAQTTHTTTATMLFDTPGISIAAPIASSSSAQDSNKKRKRTSESATAGAGAGGVPAAGKDAAAKGAEVNLDKLMKRMKKLDKDQGWGGQLGGGGKSGAEGTGQQEKNGSANKKHKSKKGKGEGATSAEGGGAAPSPAKPHRFEPAKKDKRAVKAAKLAAKQTFTPASSANAISSLVDRAPPVAEVASSPKAPVRASAPNFEEEAVAGTSTGQPKQTALQTSLRAKLAGGKFRMLNETLYTSTGEQAWETMKEEGAFDDVRSGCVSSLAARS